MKPRKINTRPRFIAAYVLVALLAFGAVVATAGQFKQGVARPAVSHAPRPHGCTEVTCVKVGDKFSVVLEGHVSSISQPQPGVLCVQIQERTHAGDYCVATRRA